MFATLQAALGTWPSETAYIAAGDDNREHASSVNERFNFPDEHTPIIPAASVFVVIPESFPSDKVFIPPDFVPPGHEQNGPDFYSGATTHGSAEVDEILREQPNVHPNDDFFSATPLLPALQAFNKSAARDGSAYSSELLPQRLHTLLNRSSPSPSPTPPDEGLELEKELNWSDDARRAFQTMITAPGYVNRYRLRPNKGQRFVYHLQNPDAEPTNPDGTKDHQTKYQAANWTVHNGHLYRKPHSRRVSTLRRHLDEYQVWDVLTREHLRSGHLGRDKLRKVLERRYIGYTVREIMFVLRECRRCVGKERKASGIAENVRPGDDQHAIQMTPDEDGTARRQNGDAEPGVAAEDSTVSKGPFGRKQTSNFMFF